MSVLEYLRRQIEHPLNVVADMIRLGLGDVIVQVDI